MLKNSNSNISIVLKNKWLVLIVFVLAMVFANLYLKGIFSIYIYSSGDEPHYIMMSDSLIKDRDLNLRNQYEDKAAMSRYSTEKVFPHLSASVNSVNSDSWYSIHTVGLPVLIMLPFKYLGLNGTRIFLTVLQLSSIVLFYIILKKYLHDNRRIMLGLILVLSCTFFWQNLSAIMPDLMMVAFFLACILFFGRKDLLSNLAFVAVGSFEIGRAHV